MKIPKSAYIDTADYKTPKELADRLLYLDRNQTAYNSFFRWRKNVQYKESMPNPSLCEMCIQMNLEKYFGAKQSILNNLGEYWNKKDCRNPTDIKL